MTKIVKKTLSRLLLGMISLSYSSGMEVTTGTPQTLHTIGQELHRAVHTPNFLNSVYCPMGIEQTLALLNIVAEERIKTEISQFVDDQQFTKNAAQLNQLLTENSAPYVPTYKGDERVFDFTNGVYALLSHALSLDPALEQEFKAMGSKLISLNFSDRHQAAAKINNIVAEDTRNKIPEILTPEALSSGAAFVLLHTLYVNASWHYRADESSILFKDIDAQKRRVKSMELEGHNLRFFQNEGVTLVSLTALGNCQMIIRHNAQNVRDLRPITLEEVSSVTTAPEQYVKTFNAPYLSMKDNHDLKKLLLDDLPQTLQTNFRTKLTNTPLQLSDYIQKVTFDMTNKGVEAAAATAMRFMVTSCGGFKNGPEIMIDSPFTFALVKIIDNIPYLLFQGQVINQDVMKIMG